MGNGSEGETEQGLTPRMWEVAQLMAEGCTNREIGERLGISVGTVRNHIVAISDRLGIQGGRPGNRVRARVTRWVMENGERRC